jgi:SecD/SecF fusion protein
MLHFTRTKTVLIWLAVAISVLFAAPNLLSKDQLAALPSWLPSQQMTLGLDLQGGSHILLQVEKADLVAERLATTRDDVRRVLRDAKIEYTGLSSSGSEVKVTVPNAEKLADARGKLGELTAPINSTLFSSGSVSEIAMTEPTPGNFSLKLTDDGIRYRISSAASQSLEVIGNRINELGTTEPVIQRQGDDRILVQVPGLEDPERLKNLLGQTAKLTFQMVDQTMSAEDALQSRPPAGSEIMYSQDDPPVPYVVESRVLVAGENLVDAQTSFNQQNNEPVVTFRFDTKGSQRFAQATQQNVGRPFAIILDKQVISAPVINEPIIGGSGQISGNFSVESANDLAVLLRAGALPATLTVVEERTVGPGLGADSINAGKIASLIAGALVVAFMLFAYGFLGLLANIALMANVAMIIAVLSLLGATLTLPGIAGIVLTVGMAVDSNVLIYERVREERRMGRSFIQSMDSGFSQALATIVDANLTTFIAAAVLFFLGSGPVKGFAVTLAIGILTTVFTAFTLTRWLVAQWIRIKRPKEIPNGLFRLVPDVTNVGFMRFRNYAFAFSVITSVISLGWFAYKDMNYGIDFRGGSIIEVQAKGAAADVADIRARLGEINLGDVQVQSFGNEKDVLIRVESQDLGDGAEQTAVVKVRDALEEDYNFRRVEVVGSTVSAELIRNGILGVVAALVAIVAYVWFRFEWQFGLGALIATGHDVVLTIGLFAISGMEFNLTSIAAILTIMGYSLNDTVVVYDRVRENLRRYKKMSIVELLDLSMNQTLSRTVLTGLTTLLALGALWLFGGEVIRSFVFAMLFGIIVGTYSSIFIAGPLLILFRLRAGGTSVDKDTALTQPVKTA